jgi:TolA-binding protein
VGAVIASVLVAHALAAANTEDFAAYKRRILAPLEAAYAKVAAEHGRDPMLNALQERLKQIDAATELLLARVRTLEASSFENMLSDRTRPASVSPRAKNTMSASEIYLEYAADFGASLRRFQLPEEATKTLVSYYTASLNASRDYVAKRCRSGVASGKPSTELLQLAVVLPFLQVSDERRTAGEIASLPTWMQEPGALETLESFALSIRRPLTAYAFANQRKPAAERSSRQVGLPAYLRAAAERLLEGREYHAALHCLKTATDLAEKENRAGEVAWLRFRRAEVLATVGYSNMAAAEVQQLLERYPKSDSYSRAAMLRLKYLYESDQFPAAIEESSRYCVEERVKPHLPQMLYIRWLALRRVNRLEEAKKVQNAFLEQFPDHPLAADMLFASAMAALATSDYPETLRLLDLIEYRYPNSKLLPKVKELQQRLQSSSQSSHPPQP